jgi:hypothetical protein
MLAGSGVGVGIPEGTGKAQEGPIWAQSKNYLESEVEPTNYSEAIVISIACLNAVFQSRKSNLLYIRTVSTAHNDPCVSLGPVCCHL